MESGELGVRGEAGEATDGDRGDQVDGGDQVDSGDQVDGGGALHISKLGAVLEKEEVDSSIHSNEKEEESHVQNDEERYARYKYMHNTCATAILLLFLKTHHTFTF